MKLRDIPDPVWYGLLAVVAIGGVYWLTKRAAGAVGDAAYNFGDKVQNALVPGEDSLGTGFYGLLHHDMDPNAAPGTLAAREASIFDATTWGAFGRAWYTLWYGEDNAALYYGDKPAAKPKPSGYDYGQGGDSGIPYREGAYKLPDPFDYSLSYLDYR